MRSRASGDRPPTRRVATVDLATIVEALDDASDGVAWWYDPATGEVEVGLAEGNRLGDDDEDDDADDPSDRGLVPIEHPGASAAYRDMVDFAESVADANASDLLTRALEGRGAFRRFRNTLHELPVLEQHWRTYTAAASERRAIDWLCDNGFIDADDAQIERARRTATLTAMLTAISAHGHLELDEADVPDRWDEVRDSVDSGHGVAVLRDGRPWATITPRRSDDSR